MRLKNLIFACLCFFNAHAMEMDKIIPRDALFLHMGRLPADLQAKIFVLSFFPTKTLEEALFKFKFFCCKVARLVYRNESMAEAIEGMLNVTRNNLQSRLQIVLHDAFIRSCAHCFLVPANDLEIVIANAQIAKTLGTREAMNWLMNYLENSSRRLDVVEKHLAPAIISRQLRQTRFLLSALFQLNISSSRANRSAPEAQLLLGPLYQIPPHIDMFKLLLCYCDPACCLDPYTGNTALHIIASQKCIINDKQRDYEFRIELLELLLNHGISLNITNKTGLSPFALAIKAGHLDIAQYLLDKGSTPRVLESGTGYTVLHLLAHISVGPGNEEQIGKLIEGVLKAGAAIDAANKNEETPLMVAIARNNMQRACFLLNHGASPWIGKKNMNAYDRISKLFTDLIEEGFTSQFREREKDRMINEYQNIMDIMDKYPAT